MTEMHFVDSSNIEAVGYDEVARQLHVRFVQSGETYSYYDVEESVYSDLMLAGSKGSYFNSNIRDRYQYGKL